MPVRDSNMRPSRNTRYSFAEQGTAISVSSGSTMGKHVLRRIPGVDYWSPSWDDECIIRCFPAVSREADSGFEPTRYSNNHCDFSDWIRVYDAVRNFGNPGVTMLLHDGMDPSYEAQIMNPCWILYRAINNALSQGQGQPDWVPLTRGGQGRGAQLSKPNKLYLVQCAIYRHKGKDTFGPGKPPLGASAEGPTIVMGLPSSAGESLLRLLEEKDEDWKGDPDDFAQFKHGDVVDLKTGGFIHFYQLGNDPRARYNTQRQALSPASIYSSAPSAQSFGNNKDAKGYGVFITRTLDDRGPDDIPASLEGLEDMVRGKVRAWDDVLDFKSDEEQARLVAPLFPASAILYAWRDHPSWIPDSVREAANYESRSPVSSSAPPSAMSNAPWGRPRPQQTQTQAAPKPTYAEPFVETDDEMPNHSEAVESLGDDPILDEAAKIAAAKAKLEAAQRRTKKG